MLEELKKKSLKKARNGLIVCCIIGIALIAICAGDILRLIKGPIPFENLTNKEIKDQYVEAEIWISAGCYAEEYSKNTKTNVTKTTSLYYVILTEDPNEFAYMGIEVKPGEEKKFDKILQKSSEILSGEEITDYSYAKKYTGTIAKMKGKQLQYYKEYLLEMGMTEEIFNESALPYYIKVGIVGRFPAPVSIIGGSIGLLLLLISLFRFIRIKSGKYQKKLIKYLEAEGPSAMTAAEADYTSAKDFANDTKIGRIYTYFWNGSESRILKNIDIVWAYMKTTTHKRNGVKTGTTYEILVNDINKKTYNIPVNNEASTISILEYMSEHVSNAVIGYDDELSKMFRKNFTDFLNLRYNQAEANNNLYQDQTLQNENNSTITGEEFQEIAATEEDPFASVLQQNNRDRNNSL